jgi:hypothetical protein
MTLRTKPRRQSLCADWRIEAERRNGADLPRRGVVSLRLGGRSGSVVFLEAVCPA